MKYILQTPVYKFKYSCRTFLNRDTYKIKMKNISIDIKNKTSFCLLDFLIDLKIQLHLISDEVLSFLQQVHHANEL